MQFSKTAYFHLNKKLYKLKKYSAFTNARNLLYDIIKHNYYFYKHLIFNNQNKIEYQLYQQDYQTQYSENKIQKINKIFYD